MRNFLFRGTRGSEPLLAELISASSPFATTRFNIHSVHNKVINFERLHEEGEGEDDGDPERWRKKTKRWRRDLWSITTSAVPLQPRAIALDPSSIDEGFSSLGIEPDMTLYLTLPSPKRICLRIDPVDVLVRLDAEEMERWNPVLTPADPETISSLDPSAFRSIWGIAADAVRRRFFANSSISSDDTTTSRRDGGWSPLVLRFASSLSSSFESNSAATTMLDDSRGFLSIDGGGEERLSLLLEDLSRPSESDLEVRLPRIPSARSVERLVGFGAGLTPSGDDLLLGMSAAMRFAGHPHSSRFAEILDGFGDSTTAISASFFESAARGEFGEDLHHLLRRICEFCDGRKHGRDGGKELTKSIDKFVSEHGFSSGADCLFGILLMFQLLLDPENLRRACNIPRRV